jgi:hypothetical protein
MKDEILDAWSATRKQSSQTVLQAIIGDFHGAAVTHFEPH